MITTVIFDLDDTLYNEIDYCKSGFKATARFLAGLAESPSAEAIFTAFWESFNSGERHTIFNTALERLGINYDDELIKKMVETYRNHLPDITLPGDSEDVLKWLHSQYSLGLLTDGFLPSQRLKVDALGLEKFFECIIYTEELGREFWKPSPRAFEIILERLAQKPDNSVYIADNEKKDFIAPNKLGFSTVQLIRQAGIHTESSNEPNAQAQHKIRQITELPGLLLKL